MSNRDYSCTPWVTGMEELAGAGSDAGAPLADPATLRAGCVKKAQYASSSMGVKVRVCWCPAACYRQGTASALWVVGWRARAGRRMLVQRGLQGC